jgi:choline dehydrogenase-like flavoprotein
MTQFDYVVVGAGPAGCVLANRLSADPATTVLLVEAGGEDTNPLIAMPRGFAELLGDPATAWHYPTRAFGPSQQTESWVRGKTLGGSSSVNGMVYNRGHAADYDALESTRPPRSSIRSSTAPTSPSLCTPWSTRWCSRTAGRSASAGAATGRMSKRRPLVR